MLMRSRSIRFLGACALSIGLMILGGNAGTDPPTDYLGTSDATPLELRANGERVLRLEPASDSDGNTSPNVWGQPGKPH